MINKNILKHANHHGFGEEEIYGAYKIFFGTLVSKQRLKIINLLRNGSKNVSEIMSELKMDQTSVSHDLAKLKKCGFAEVEIEGKFRYYKINNSTITPIMEMIEKHMAEHCITILKSMEKNKA